VDMDRLYHGVKNAVRLRGLGPYVQLVKAKSDAAIDDLKASNVQADVLIIDGNHSPVQSVQDVKNYIPLLRSGGILFFDDADWPETQNAVDLIFETCDQAGMIQSMAMFKKL
jgi:predicted O-methyltransferase YrrM